MFPTSSGAKLLLMNLKATPKCKVLYVVNTARGQALYLGPRRPSLWERLKQLAGGSQAAAS
jgi:hypothetical protein